MLPENERSLHYASRYETEVKWEGWGGGGGLWDLFDKNFMARRVENVAVMS